LPCEEEKYNKYLTFIWPFTGVLFNIWAIDPTPSMTWVYVGVPACVISFAFFYGTQYKSGPKHVPEYFILLAVMGALSGLLWTYLVSGVLIDLLTMIGVICKLSTTYLSLTILAIGNALPDALTTIALAKQGNAIMGLTGTYAG